MVPAAPAGALRHDIHDRSTCRDNSRMAEPRARDLGIRIGLLEPGPLNAITDVPGVRVGHTTIVSGDGPLVVGQGPVRTGVTVIVPGGEPFEESFFAGCHRLNGNGELTGLEWVRESGMLTTPIAITNTHSVGVVRDALITAAVRRGPRDGEWSLPVVGETYDGWLSDMDGQHVHPEHVFAALEAAAGGPVAEGNVGGGTAMICHEFKGGIGTSSRVLPEEDGGWTVGVLVQANYGRRERLTIGGIPVGRAIPTTDVPSAWDDIPTGGAPDAGTTEGVIAGGVERPTDLAGAGSIIVIVATDAPLLPHQCERMAQRAGLGIARTGGSAAHSSGDLFLCFATGNRSLIVTDDAVLPHTRPLTALVDAWISPLFWAVIEATEEAIANALVAAWTMTGRDGRTAHALPHDRLRELVAAWDAMLETTAPTARTS
jgi:D-aminopeptidase